MASSIHQESESCHSLDLAIHEYLMAIGRGENVDAEDFVARYPQHATSFLQFIEDQNPVGSLLGSSTAAAARHESTRVNVNDNPEPQVAARAREAIEHDANHRTFGEYPLRRILGVGGMGIVYETVQPRTGRPAALKLCKYLHRADTSSHARFLFEARTAASLDHPNIVPILSCGEVNGQLYILMKLIDGQSLKHQPRQSPRDEVARIVPIVEAVQHAHEQEVVHRDLKPSNILLDSQGVPYVSDFGLAKQIDTAERLTITGSSVGTPQYMSPEQARSEKCLTAASDIYSLGVILFERVTGASPYAATEFLEIVTRVQQGKLDRIRLLDQCCDRELKTIILKALELHPSDRYASCRDLSADLSAWLRGDPISLRRQTPLGSAFRWMRRHPWRTFLAATLLLLVVITASLAFVNYRSRLQLQATRYANLTDRARNEAIDRQSGWKDRVQSALREARQLTVVADNVQLDSLLTERNLGFDISDPEFTLAIPRISVVRFHPTKPWLIAAAKNGGSESSACPIFVIDTETGNIVRRILVHASQAARSVGIQDVIVSSDGKFLIVGTRADGLQVFALEGSNDRPEHVFDLGGLRVHRLYEFDGPLVVVINHDESGNAELWTIDARRWEICNYKRLGEGIAAAVAARDLNKLILSLTSNLSFLDPQTLNLSTLTEMRPAGDLAYHDGKLAASSRHGITLFDALHGEKLTDLLPPPGGYTRTRWDAQIAFTPDGSHLALADDERNQVHVWATSDNLYCHSFAVSDSLIRRVCFDFSARGMFAASGGADVVLAKISVPSIDLLCPPSYPIRAIDLDPTGETMAVLRESRLSALRGRVEIYKACSTGYELATSFEVRGVPDFNQPKMCLSTNAQWIAIATEKPRFITHVRLFSTADGTEVAASRPLSAFRSVAPKGNDGFAIGSDSGLLSWCYPFPDSVERVTDLEYNASSISVLGDNDWYVGDEAGRIIALRRDGNPSTVKTLSVSTARICTSAVCDQSEFIAFGDADGQIYIWDTNTQELADAYSAHWSGVTALAWLGPGRLVSAGGDQMLRFWHRGDDETGFHLHREVKLASNVARIFPDSRRWAAGQTENVILVRENAMAVERLRVEESL